jgi:hypothetical protein
MSNPHPESPANQRLNRLGFVLFLRMANSIAVLGLRGKSFVSAHSKSWQFEGRFGGKDGVSRHEPGGQQDDDGQSQCTDEEDGVYFVGERRRCCIGCIGEGIPEVVMVRVRRCTAPIRMPVANFLCSPKHCLHSFSQHQIYHSTQSPCAIAVPAFPVFSVFGVLSHSCARIRKANFRGLIAAKANGANKRSQSAALL